MTSHRYSPLSVCLCQPALVSALTHSPGQTTKKPVCRDAASPLERRHYISVHATYASSLVEGGNDSSCSSKSNVPPCVKHAVARRKPLEFAHSLVLKERGRRRRRANITIVLLL